MITRATFLEQYSDFASASDAEIDAKLAQAALSIGEVFDTHEDHAHGLLTAHLLAIDPKGKFARLESEKGQSTFGAQYIALRTKVTAAYR